MSQSAYPTNPAITAIAIAYKNADYIADIVAPRIPVGSEEFTWMKYDDETYYTLPETEVGRRGSPEEVNMKAVEVPGTVIDHGLDGGVPNKDIKNAENYKDEQGVQVYDPLGDEAMLLRELVAARREARVASMVMNPDTYNPDLRQLIGAGGKFDLPGTDVVGIVEQAIDDCLFPPNQMVMGRSDWLKFKSLPQIREAIRGTAGAQGRVTASEVADLFELKEVVIGTAKANTAKRGQAPVFSRMWTGGIALLHRAPVVRARGAVTFMGTFEWGMPVGMQWENPKMGLRGGMGVRVGESVVEKVIANMAGALIQSPYSN